VGYGYVEFEGEFVGDCGCFFGVGYCEYPWLRFVIGVVDAVGIVGVVCVVGRLCRCIIFFVVF